jgi:serine/threonine protein kinase
VKEPDKELLAALLIRWEELYERGQDTPAAELAKDHPTLVTELDRRIKVLKKVAWLDKPLDDDPGGQDPPSPSSPPQRTIAGRYRLDELIAEGGFARVYRAYDKDLQRTVAIKVPKPSKLESTEAFLAEARRAARLKHDGIVPVHDVGIDGDTVFIVSEYLEGGSLADHLSRGKLDPGDAVRWVAQIADALEYAHLNGVIHRDIKPANIVIDHHGRAKLTDFGIAQSASKTGSFAPSLGTLRYMAPEQLQGTSADHRSDIYSLAVVLYEALTGRVPYSSFEPNVLRREIVHGRPAVLGELPHPLRPICEKSLSKTLHQRHPSAAQFASDLRRASLRHGSIPWQALIAIPWLAVLIAGSYFLLPFQTNSTSLKTPAGESEPYSDFKYTLNSEGATITQYAGLDTDIVIPDHIGGRPVVAIGNDAFNGRHFIKTIRFPKTLLGSGNASFAGCNDLQSLDLPPQLRHIGFNAFQFCVNLKQVEIPASVTTIGAVCFFGSRNIEAINVHPENIKYASVDGILYDKEVKTLITCPPGKKGVVEIPSTVIGILGWSFAGCDLLTRIIIPESVTDIHPDAFRDCDVERVKK